MKLAYGNYHSGSKVLNLADSAQGGPRLIPSRHLTLLKKTAKRNFVTWAILALGIAAVSAAIYYDSPSSLNLGSSNQAALNSQTPQTIPVTHPSLTSSGSSAAPTSVSSSSSITNDSSSVNVTVNGESIPVPANGSSSQTVTSGDNQTIINTDHQASSSGGTNTSSINVSVDSSSSN